MTTLNISLSGEPLQRLRELAREAGIAPEEFLRESVERWLAAKPPPVCFVIQPIIGISATRKSAG